MHHHRHPRRRTVGSVQRVNEVHRVELRDHVHPYRRCQHWQKEVRMNHDVFRHLSPGEQAQYLCVNPPTRRPVKRLRRNQQRQQSLLRRSAVWRVDRHRAPSRTPSP